MTRILGFLAIAAICFGCAHHSQFAFGLNNNKTRQQEDDSPLMNPDQANEEAPDIFYAKFETTKGDFIVQVNRKWSPNGADRFYNLVKIGYFKDIAIFRAIEGFMFQFGIHGDPDVSAVWREANIKADPPSEASNLEGYITYAQGGDPDSRTVQLFINLGDNARLDGMGFTPFGKVVKGLEVAKTVNTEYGENDREDQMKFQKEGNAYIKDKYPNLDMIRSVTLVEKEE